MIKINRVQIWDFMSIGYVELNIPKGITELSGLNLDAKEQGASNGSGKSSILLAVIQCLFNKNPKVELKNLNNEITEKPYRIIMHMEAKGKSFVIDNDRNKNKITITSEDNIILSSRIKESLSFIETDLLNLTYQEFITLTYISSDSLKSIFDLTSSNILLKLFNLSELDDYISKLKMERRLLTREKSRLSFRQIPEGDIEELEKEIKALKKEAILNLSKHNQGTHLEIQTLTDEIKELSRKIKSSVNGVCSQCGQVLPKVEDVKYLESRKKDASYRLKALTEEVNSIEAETKRLEDTINILEAKVTTLRNVEIANTSNNKEALASILKDINVINGAIKTIESGNVHKIFLEHFLFSINRKLVSNAQGNFKVHANLEKSSITYSITTDGARKTKSQLSAGELTVVSLTILLSMYQSLKDLLGVDVNLLILDEAIHATDKANELYVSDLLTRMEKDIIIVQHHDEINPSIFKNKVRAVKRNGITELEV